jgi:hypothetical protein
MGKSNQIHIKTIVKMETVVKMEIMEPVARRP